MTDRAVSARKRTMTIGGLKLQLLRCSTWLLVAAFFIALDRSACGQTVVNQQRGHDLAVVRELLQTPEDRIDLAQAKLMIDRLIEPGIDTAATLAQLDAMVRGLRAMLPANASKRLTLDALRYHLYTPSPWNGNRPFQYDLGDPLGTNIHNKLLTNYLDTRRGNCVSMPMLFIILGQKLGIDVAAAEAPNHIFVKYRDDEGSFHNLETTSGANFTRDVWFRQQMPMSDEALASGLYMRPLSRRETLVLMAGTLLEFYAQRGMQQQRISMARLMLEFKPKDVVALLGQHQAYLAMWHEEFVSRYPTPQDIPTEKQPRYLQLEKQLKAFYGQLYALGWRPLASDALNAAVRKKLTK